jgi:hypothetical protein
MPSLIDRLRGPTWARQYEIDRLCAEAADEIERLNAEIERLYGLLETIAEKGWTREAREALDERDAILVAQEKP